MGIVLAFKRAWKYIISIECLVILGIIIAIFLFLFPLKGSSKLDEADLQILENVKDCMSSTGQPMSLDKCAESFTVTSEEVNAIASKVLEKEELQIEKAWALMVEKNFSGAEPYLNLSYKENPFDVRGYRDMAFSYLNMNNYEKALEFCNVVLQRNSADIQCLDMQGIAYYMLDKNAEALKNAEKSNEIQPHICRELNIGLYNAGIGNITGAKQIIDAVIEKDKQILLRCWSPIRMEIPPEDIDRFNLCFQNKQTEESVCRPFAKKEWATKGGKPEQPQLPEPVYSYSQ